MPSAPFAIVAGQGKLPELLASAVATQGRDVHLVLFDQAPPEWTKEYTIIPARFEKPGEMFLALKKANCVDVAFAGSMVRPRLNPLKFDKKMISVAGKLLPALKGGDNAALTLIQKIFEDEGLNLVGAHEMLSDLLAPSGNLTKGRPNSNDLADIERAKVITKQLGVADVGQGAVVAQGLCLALESIQGTDAMLGFVADHSDNYRPDADGGQGVLLKAPKLDQDWRADLPAIGPETVKNAYKARLAGIAVQTGGVLILGLSETVAMADELGLFIYGFDKGAAKND